MDFDKTSFSVDWYTPGDKYAPKRLSFPKSARISIDDLVPDSPLSFCFTPVDGTVLRPRSYSFVDTPLDTARGWTNSAPPSPPADREQVPVYDRDQDRKEREENALDCRAFASPGLQSIADDCALCGVDLNVSCLSALDEQLLCSPVECFTELCWASAVHEEAMAPAPVHHPVPSRARSFKCDYEPTFSSPLAKDHSGSFERTRPLAARIMLPLDRLPHYISTPSFESYNSTTTFQEKPMAYFQETDCGRPLALSVQGIPVPRRSKKRGGTSTQSSERRAPAHSQPPKPNHTLRVISDAYSTFTRSRRKSRH